MTRKALTLAALVVAGVAAQPAIAQETDAGTTEVSSNGTSFRGIRIEGNIGGDRFQSQGDHHGKFGFGGAVGFDGMIGDRFVVGAEATFWKPGSGNENCNPLPTGQRVCHKAFQEWGAAVRAGVMATPDLLVFAKAGYVNGEQRFRIDSPTGAVQVYDHYRADGYQLGAGVEYTVRQSSVPVYVSAQYVYSNYHGHTSRGRIMGGVGIRFK